MDPERHQRASEIFLRALDSPPSLRVQFLDQECGDDHELRAEVESLLSHEPLASAVLPSGALIAVSGASSEGDRHEAPPERIGSYRILGELGKGGMGVVYLAEQDRPIQRRVALKLIKRGMDTEKVIRRFESERQALALMSHVNIARVYDAGATADGRPYFVMEYVEGVFLTDYSDSRCLGIQDRIKLFIQVCEGVQHAHQKGIAHRDIKPSNVLVLDQDGQAVPKVIDFGIAKATAERLAGETLGTEAGQILGTPEFMSPEQADPTCQDVDTRTDVYSLGVLLYVLLVGVLPFESEKWTEEELRRAIREDSPPLPSRRLSSLEERSAGISAGRRLDPRGLVRRLRGDLDWIVLKALEKQRGRRYSSPADFAADLQRHLRNEPVLAGPPSRVYRLKKFVRRHRIGVTAASLVVLALVVGITGTTLGMVRALRAESAAKAARAQANQQAENAKREADLAHKVTEFLTNLFQVPDPSEAKGSNITAREVLDRGASKIARELDTQPSVRSRLMGTMGRVYRNLGLYEEARPLLEEALSIQQSLAPTGDLDVAVALDNWASLLKEIGKFQEAKGFYEQALTIRRRILPAESALVSTSLNNIGVCDYETGRNEEARQVLGESLKIREKTLPADHLDLATSRMNLGLALSNSTDDGDRERARSLLLAAKRILEVKTPDSPDLAQVLDNLGAMYAEGADLEQAEPLMRAALQIRERVYRPNHPDIAISLVNLANLLLEQKDYEEARLRYERAIRIWEGAKVAEHQYVADAKNNLASLFIATGRHKEGRQRHRDAIEILTKAYGPSDPSIAELLEGFAGYLEHAGLHREAEEAISHARQIRNHQPALEPKRD